jgi:hypothetical protein
MKLNRNDAARLSVCYHFLLEGLFTGECKLVHSASTIYSDNREMIRTRIH